MADKDVIQSPEASLLCLPVMTEESVSNAASNQKLSGYPRSAMADLYAKDVRNINEHLMNIFSDGEIEQNSTIRKFRIVRQEGKRQECVASLSGKLPVTSFINPSPPKERDRIFAIRVTEVPYSSGPHI